MGVTNYLLTGMILQVGWPGHDFKHIFTGQTPQILHRRRGDGDADGGQQFFAARAPSSQQQGIIGDVKQKP